MCRHFFICWRRLAFARWIVKASLPEVNQFTGNCFRVVRIVLKITFLWLRYPGQRPECPSLSYYGSWSTLIKKLMQTYIVTASRSILNVSAVDLNGIWHLIWLCLSKPVLGGHPVLSGHYSIPRGRPLNTGFTVVPFATDPLLSRFTESIIC